jgi:hypothetical protein
MCAEKQAISVSEMAKMVGLSRARFYQLIGSAFPSPVYDVATKRPYFSPELQQACLEVRRQNQGIDGKPILFHRQRREIAPASPKKPKRKAAPNDLHYTELLGGLKSLGLAGVTAKQVETAMKSLHVSGRSDGEVLRAVFLALKRQDISAPMESEEK